MSCEVGRNPVGVGSFVGRSPRVAVKARQPWALRRNRFAVFKTNTSILEHRTSTTPHFYNTPTSTTPYFHNTSFLLRRTLRDALIVRINSLVDVQRLSCSLQPII